MINLYTGREYYSLPAKKAADLQSLDELNLSKSAERYLEKYYQTLHPQNSKVFTGACRRT